MSSSPVHGGGDEEARFCVECGKPLGDPDAECSPFRHGAGERADAIPDTWTLTICERSGQLPWDCGLSECENGCQTREVEVRAAHPEAGSEEAERVKRIALDNLRGYQEATAGLDRALDDMRRERDEARAEVAALRAAHPEADRAPEALRRKGFHEAATELEDSTRMFYAPHSGHAVEADRAPERCRRCGSAERLNHCEDSAYGAPCDMHADREPDLEHGSADPEADRAPKDER